MGDKDDECYIDTASRKGLLAMAKLFDMKVATEADDSGYYDQEVEPTLEETLQKDHPAVKDAWGKYQTVLRLAKSEHYGR